MVEPIPPLVGLAMTLGFVALIVVGAVIGPRFADPVTKARDRALEAEYDRRAASAKAEIRKLKP